jgi:prepilin-type processing-associated H-X9-DG protein
VAAHAAFLDWHAEQDGTNILDLVTRNVPAG